MEPGILLRACFPPSQEKATEANGVLKNLQHFRRRGVRAGPKLERIPASRENEGGAERHTRETFRSLRIFTVRFRRNEQQLLRRVRESCVKCSGELAPVQVAQF
jgi:hypothetical protein